MLEMTDLVPFVSLKALREGGSERGWVEALGILPGSSEVRNAKPAIFNARPGSIVESTGAALPLDSPVPCNTASGPG